MIPTEKIYGSDNTAYDQKSVSARFEALFLNNVGLVVTRLQIIAAAHNPVTGREPENWYQRLAELRTVPEGLICSVLHIPSGTGCREKI